MLGALVPDSFDQLSGEWCVLAQALFASAVLPILSSPLAVSDVSSATDAPALAQKAREIHHLINERMLQTDAWRLAPGWNRWSLAAPLRRSRHALVVALAARSRWQRSLALRHRRPLPRGGRDGVRYPAYFWCIEMVMAPGQRDEVVKLTKSQNDLHLMARLATKKVRALAIGRMSAEMAW